jgi:hypothetical protein
MRVRGEPCIVRPCMWMQLTHTLALVINILTEANAFVLRLHMCDYIAQTSQETARDMASVTSMCDSKHRP